MNEMLMQFWSALWPWLLISAPVLLFVYATKPKKDDRRDDWPDDWPQHGCHP